MFHLPIVQFYEYINLLSCLWFDWARLSKHLVSSLFLFLSSFSISARLALTFPLSFCLEPEIQKWSKRVGKALKMYVLSTRRRDESIAVWLAVCLSFPAKQTHSPLLFAWESNKAFPSPLLFSVSGYCIKQMGLAAKHVFRRGRYKEWDFLQRNRQTRQTKDCQSDIFTEKA